MEIDKIMPPIIMFIIPQNPNPLLQARLEWPNIYFYIILKSELYIIILGHTSSAHISKVNKDTSLGLF